LCKHRHRNSPILRTSSPTKYVNISFFQN